ncbi:lysoplasmalogenase [Rhodococcus sp. CX]|uniref:lysoplasmalogenase family protein n=1 Tax=Rhodococcus sp. CX TaxID=2789880 RepID=UPI0018CFC8B4|nr:lysoplasmalogenase family protein [Rhodococcus sp. CX]MBH0122113.1 lysoplasmalogenase [Rhodococcus sp. CX]
MGGFSTAGFSTAGFSTGWFGRRKWGAEHAVFAAATAATVLGGVLGNEKLQQVAKPLIAPALAVRVLRRSRDTDRVETALLLAGLAAATVGDVFMIDPDDDRRLLRGAASFAVMQTSYSTLLARRGARPHAIAAVPRAAAALGAGSLLAAKSRNVAAPLTGYGTLLATTATLAADPVPRPSTDRRSWLGLGGLVFTISDGTIVVRRVLLKNRKVRAAAEGLILATYAAAQLLLVEGMLAGRRK